MLRYHNHLEEFSKTGSLDNYKMACLELRMASSRLNHKLNKLEASSSSSKSFLVKDKIMNTLAGGCKPYEPTTLNSSKKHSKNIFIRYFYHKA